MSTQRGEGCADPAMRFSERRRWHGLRPRLAKGKDCAGSVEGQSRTRSSGKFLAIAAGQWPPMEALAENSPERSRPTVAAMPLAPGRSLHESLQPTARSAGLFRIPPGGFPMTKAAGKCGCLNVVQVFGLPPISAVLRVPIQPCRVRQL